MAVLPRDLVYTQLLYKWEQSVSTVRDAILDVFANQGAPALWAAETRMLAV